MSTDFVEVLLLLVGLHDDLVVNVGDVHAQFNVVAEVVSHNSPQVVEADVGLGMSQMGVVVHGWAAHVPSN